MNIKTKRLFYYARRAAFLIYLTLALAKRGQQLAQLSKGFTRVAKDVWWSLLSLYFSLRGEMTSTNFSRG